ncbi:hypothetical protein KUTeg_000152 [Tegillarca granosa]|uniref:Uncharacterized protein n=1 Tax=Tegillarca granosa TaxID=220873 RepID=A0ABQ9FWR4_TEGGR|nr:hypothetical protein KUTeg_000152 [Tegillarca granosa]
MEGFVNHVAYKLNEVRFGCDDSVNCSSFKELKTKSYWKGVLAELVATLLFVYMGVSSTIVLTDTPDIDVVQDTVTQ